MFDKCPCCGSPDFHKIKPQTGDSLFICACDDAKHRIYSENGIICDFYVCSSCRSIQLRAKEAQ